MPKIQKSLRIPEEITNALEEAAEAMGRDFSAMTNELLQEALKMRRCPGVIFADGPSGRRAIIAGTGLDVWEVIANYQSLDCKFKRLRRAYHWLSEPQLKVALGYYAAYPEEIDTRIARDAAWTRDHLAKQHPSLSAGNIYS